jgi:CheY-like chemotaxis protein
MDTFGLTTATTSGQEDTFDRDMEGRRILLVEDNKANQQVATEMLMHAGLLVDVVGNGRLAVEAVGSRHYDAVLMDMQMPEMDGLEATATIRRSPSLADLPIIAMTANAMKGDRERCLAAGMDDYVTKPVDRRELFGALRKYIAGAGSDGTRRVAFSHSHKRPEAIDAEQPPERLDGIEVAEGLERLGLGWESFKKLLQQYAEANDSIVADLRHALDTHDKALIGRLAHSLAGSGGSLGMTDLRDTAKTLENAAASGEEPERWSAMFEELLAEYERVKASIASLSDGNGAPHPAPDPGTEAAYDPAPVLAALDELSGFIDEMAPKDCAAIVEKLSGPGLPDHLRSDIERIGKQITNYDFDAAQDTLAAAVEKIRSEPRQ